MKSLKKLICVLLSALVLTSAFSFTSLAAAPTSGQTGDCAWQFFEGSGMLSVSGNGAMANYGSYKEVPWYSLSNKIKSVIIFGGVENISGYAFYKCESLTGVSMGETVTAIGDRAFYGCGQLANLSLPDSITNIGDGAFYGCGSLSKIRLPAAVESVGRFVFQDCVSLSEVVFPDGLRLIGYESFYNCTSLKSVDIPSGVTGIGERALGYYYYDGGYKTVEGFTVNGYLDTAAQTYASENGFAFNSLDEKIIKKTQKITAKSFSKTYGSKAFSLGAKASAGGKLSYSSGNKKIATVSSKGIVTIKGCGKVSIKIAAAATKYYKSAKKTVSVTVRPGKIKLTKKKLYNEGGKRFFRQAFKRVKAYDGYNVVVSYKINGVAQKASGTYDNSRNYIRFTVSGGRKYTVKLRAFKKQAKKTYVGDWVKVAFKA